MKKTVYISLILSLFFFSTGLQDKSYSVEVIDGVSYVHNLSPQWKGRLKIELKLIRAFSGFEKSGEWTGFKDIKSLVKDENGFMYILDAGIMSVVKLDPEGGYIASYSVDQDGNPIFTDPRFLEIDSNGRLYVHDSDKNIVILNPDGSVESRKMVEKFHTEVIRILDENRILMSLPGYLATDTPLIGIFNKDFILSGGIGTKTDFGNVLKNRLGNFVAFTPDREGNIYAAMVAQNAIRKYSNDGTLIWQSDRPLNYEPGLLDLNDRTTMAMVSLQIGIDLKQRIWVATFERQFTEDELKNDYTAPDLISFHIFDRTGVFLGSIPTKLFQNMQFIFGGRLYIADLTDMRVLEYDIIDK